MNIFKMLIVVMACLCMGMGCVLGAANDKLAGEYDRKTGTNWYFPGLKVTYEVSDNQVAEIIQDKKGQYIVRFIGAGDVYVQATFYSQGKPLPPETYLFHITGDKKGEDATDWGTFAMDILRLTNEERKKAGLSQLKADFALSEAAAIRAEEAVQLYSHTRPDGSPYNTVLKGINYRQAGENLQAGAATPKDAIYQWMNSPTHREILLYPDYNSLGVGYIYVPNSKYHHYWVQIFLQK